LKDRCDGKTRKNTKQLLDDLQEKSGLSKLKDRCDGKMRKNTKQLLDDLQEKRGLSKLKKSTTSRWVENSLWPTVDERLILLF
jgi:hypothetical protein